MADNIDLNKAFEKYLKKMNFNDVVNILAKKIEFNNGSYMEQYGLDELVKLTIIRCKENINGDIQISIMKNLIQ